MKSDCENSLSDLQTDAQPEFPRRLLPLIDPHPSPETPVEHSRVLPPSAVSSRMIVHSADSWPVPFARSAHPHREAFHAAHHAVASIHARSLHALSPSSRLEAPTPTASDDHSPSAGDVRVLSVDSEPAAVVAVLLFFLPAASEPVALTHIDCVDYPVQAAAFAAATHCFRHHLRRPDFAAAD